MIRPRSIAVALVVAGLALTCTAFAQTNEISINIAPSTIVLDSSATWVTVHTNLDYISVDQDTVELDGIDMAWAKADACGNFVAKFAFDDVAAEVADNAGDTVALTLTGVAEGEAFSGSDEVRIK
ncbi:MAG: hypothetical protein ACP5KN_08920 [Armatimonadota bacterium]